MKKVLILYKYLPQYRVEFFQKLKTRLFDYNIELELIHGKSNKMDALKKDEGTIEWAKCISNKSLRAGNKSIIWQPVLKHLKNIDLIIALPENKLLLNYYLMFARYFSRYKFALWGHVYAMQRDLKSFRNVGKLLFLRQCDWWFGYTEGSKQFLIDKKYPRNQITVVQNAIETINIRKYYAGITDEEISILKEQLGIVGDKTGIYCGAMYQDKGFDFLLETCYMVKKEIPDFHMIFVGSGIESSKIIKAANTSNWIHYVGPKFGKERVIYFKISSVLLMPKLVGLAIIDSFALETPLMTTINSFHGPEIDYLENGVNGVITEDNVNKYSQAVIDNLKQEKYLKLIEGGKLSAEVYTIENMVENFKNGILSCLNQQN